MLLANGKYLTFLLGEEEYAISIRDVREIIGIMDITDIPDTPAFFKGVINLRGKIIPVIDLRIKFGMEERKYTKKTCIIIMEILVQDAKKLVGVIVDTVSEVLGIHMEDIEQANNGAKCLEDEFFTGLAKVKNKVIIILDVVKILCRQEICLTKD